MNPLTDPSMAVIEAIAAAEGRDRNELDEPLFSSIDADALNAILGEESVQVIFSYHRYEVSVDGRGNIDLTKLD